MTERAGLVHEGRASGAAARVLQAHGITRVFGNPGTFELPIYDELTDIGIELVLTLHEIVSVSAAAGYAAYSRTPGVVFTHTVAGLGNAMGVLHGAAAMEIPLVVYVGEPDSRNELDSPVLVGDPASMAEPVAKEVLRLREPGQIPVGIASALTIAMRPPRGPVVLTAPIDVLLGEGHFEVPPRSDISLDSVADDLERYLAALTEAQSPLIVVGTEVAWTRSVDEAVRLAEQLNVPVMSESLNAYADFPSGHPLYRGVLPAVPSAISKVLSRYDVVLLLGANGFRPLLYDDGYPIPEGTRVLQIDNRVDWPGSRWPVDLGAVAGIRASLQRLNELASKLDNSSDASSAAESTKRPAKEPVGIEAAFAAVAAEFGDTFVVVDEGCTCSWFVRKQFPRGNDDYFACNAGNLGQGPGYAVGIGIAANDRPVLAVVGDGSVMYATQALWTAAREQAKVVFLVVNNGGYESLRQGYRSFDSKAAASGDFFGTVITPPALDYVAIGEGHGVPSSRVDTPDALVDALREALERGGPSLVEYRL
jgi:benzoylformate decarboxylase